MICLVLWCDEPKTLNMLAHWVISETITLCKGFIRFGRVLLTSGSTNSFTYICFKITSDMPCRNKEDTLLSPSASPFKLNLVLNQGYLTSCYIIGVGSCSRQLELWSFTFCQMWVRIIECYFRFINWLSSPPQLSHFLLGKRIVHPWVLRG